MGKLYDHDYFKNQQAIRDGCKPDAAPVEELPAGNKLMTAHPDGKDTLDQRRQQVLDTCHSLHEGIRAICNDVRGIVGSDAIIMSLQATLSTERKIKGDK